MRYYIDFSTPRDFESNKTIEKANNNELKEIDAAIEVFDRGKTVIVLNNKEYDLYTIIVDLDQNITIYVLRYGTGCLH